MADMIVNLYTLNDDRQLIEKLAREKIVIKRALPPDKHRVLQYVQDSFPEGLNWASECDVSFSNKPIACFIAVHNKALIGFSCYEATARGFFGPAGVSKTFRNRGVGKALLLKCLFSMQEAGYAYGIIGWPAKEAVSFYEKAVGARFIDETKPGIYGRMIDSKGE